jgi:protoporphyrinogen oxidase
VKFPDDPFVVAEERIIGSGIAGLSFALRAAAHGKVAMVTKREITESATNYAQGGIASVFSQEDTFDAHVEDTLVAGAGICNEEVVRMVVEEAALSSALVKSGWPRTTFAAPTQIWQRLKFTSSSSSGRGSCELRFLKSSTRWFTGVAAMRLASTTNSVSLA